MLKSKLKLQYDYTEQTVKWLITRTQTKSQILLTRKHVPKSVI